MTHKRRAKGIVDATVAFTTDMPLTMKKQFLANKQKKQQFIYMLSKEMQKKWDTPCLWWCWSSYCAEGCWVCYHQQYCPSRWWWHRSYCPTVLSCKPGVPWPIFLSWTKETHKKNLVSGTSRQQSRCLVKTYATTFFLYTIPDTPLGLFRQFFTTELLDIIVEESSR